MEKAVEQFGRLPGTKLLRRRDIAAATIALPR
jgi:hypothetical protein